MNAETISFQAARIHRLLRRRRQKMGLTQKATALRVGTSRQSLGQWERLYTNPTMGLLLRWAAALDFRIIAAPKETRARRQSA